MGVFIPGVVVNTTLDHLCGFHFQSVAMLSSLRREARRFPGFRSLVPQPIGSVVEISQPSRNSRLVSTSCLIHGGAQRHQSTETLAVLGAWHAAGNREPWLWRRVEQRQGMFAAKVSEVLGGKRLIVFG